MKLTFRVALELNVPEGYTLNDAAIEDYRNVVDNFPKGYREEALTCWRQLWREADENDSSSVRMLYADTYRGPEADLSQRTRGYHL